MSVLKRGQNGGVCVCVDLCKYYFRKGDLFLLNCAKW